VKIPYGGFLEFENIWEHEYNIWTASSLSFEVVGIIRIPYEPSDNLDVISIQHSNQNRLFIPTQRIWEINNIALENNLEWAAFFGLLTEGDREVWERQVNRIHDPTWILYDMADFDAFSYQANKILPEFSIIEDMVFLHHDVINSMGDVDDLMNQALIFIIGATLIILTLIILLYTRDRKHEIGVYLALGEKKVKILLQILFEVLGITTIGIIVSIFIGNIVSHQVSDFLLREAFINVTTPAVDCEIVTDPELCWISFSSLEFNGFGNRQMAMDIDDLFEIFDLTLNMRAVAIFFAIGLSTTIVSTIIPLIYVLELNPKEILLRGNVG